MGKKGEMGMEAGKEEEKRGRKEGEIKYTHGPELSTHHMCIYIYKGSSLGLMFKSKSGCCDGFSCLST